MVNVMAIVSTIAPSELADFVKVGDHKYLVELVFDKPFVTDKSFVQVRSDLFTLSADNAENFDFDIAKNHSDFGQFLLGTNSLANNPDILMRQLGYELLEDRPAYDSFSVYVYKVFNQGSYLVLSLDSNVSYYRPRDNAKKARKQAHPNDLKKEYNLLSKRIKRDQQRLEDLSTMIALVVKESTDDIADWM